MAVLKPKISILDEPDSGLDIYEARIKGEKILKVFDMGLPINSKKMILEFT